MLFALILAGLFHANAEIIYVNQGSNTNGNQSTWNNALNNLTQALQQAKAGDQIWVAKGTYTPTKKANRNASFKIKNGVELYGGFAGYELELNQRNPQKNITILSGEIGKPGIADNCYTVVQTKEVTKSTIIDGFIITGGNANGAGEEGDPIRCGGGWFNDGSEPGASQPSITNCIFKNNYGREGAAFYNYGVGGEASPIFNNCTFQDNQADLDGGAIFNNGRNGGASNPVLKNCSFERNIGTYGGAIFNATEDGICNLYLENCQFTENTALLRGGAVFNLNSEEECYLELLDCVFVGNYPDNQNKVFTTNAARNNAYQINKP